MEYNRISGESLWIAYWRSLERDAWPKYHSIIEKLDRVLGMARIDGRRKSALLPIDGDGETEFPLGFVYKIFVSFPRRGPIMHTSRLISQSRQWNSLTTTGCQICWTCRVVKFDRVGFQTRCFYVAYTDNERNLYGACGIFYGSCLMKFS